MACIEREKWILYGGDGWSGGGTLSIIPGHGWMQCMRWMRACLLESCDLCPLVEARGSELSRARLEANLLPFIALSFICRSTYPFAFRDSLKAAQN